MKRKNPHWGSTLEDFLNEDGIREAAKAEAVTRVVAWQLAEEMKRKASRKRTLQSACTRAARRWTESLRPRAT